MVSNLYYLIRGQNVPKSGPISQFLAFLNLICDHHPRWWEIDRMVSRANMGVGMVIERAPPAQNVKVINLPLHPPTPIHPISDKHASRKKWKFYPFTDLIYVCREEI